MKHDPRSYPKPPAPPSTANRESRVPSPVLQLLLYFVISTSGVIQFVTMQDFALQDRLHLLAAARIALPAQRLALAVPAYRRTYRGQFWGCKASGEQADLSGEWPVNWSLASYEDVGEFFQKSLFKDTAAPGTRLEDVMSTKLTVAHPDTSLSEAKQLFTEVTGVPVVKSKTDYTLVGVLSKKDLSKRGNSVKDTMTTPPIAARPDNKVADAACLMLKHKIHRIPVVDSSAQLVGIVTRTDIFTALENEQGDVDVKVSL